ncbi:MAG: hypothetical protein COA47_03440 [Robiginitomaculum sp.]|nr:MAG: hypothetical protein COA47_03440 [Robiginitomaculum sp.]
MVTFETLEEGFHVQMENMLRLAQSASALLIAFGIMLGSVTAAFAEPVDYAKCVAKNQKFPGATATCAAQICNWEVCKSAIIYSTGSTGRIAGASQSYREDKGAEGSALATCMPHEQIMNRCMMANTPKVAWCATGLDADIPVIQNKMDTLRTEIQENKRQYDLKTFQQEILDKEINELLIVVQSMSEEFLSDKASAGGSDEAYGAFIAKWDSGGRLALAQARQTKHTAKVTKFNGIYEQLTLDYQSLIQMKDFYNHVNGDVMETQHDCAAAKTALQSYSE